jgi:hypothetical protein
MNLGELGKCPSRFTHRADLASLPPAVVAALLCRRLYFRRLSILNNRAVAFVVWEEGRLLVSPINCLNCDKKTSFILLSLILTRFIIGAPFFAHLLHNFNHFIDGNVKKNRIPIFEWEKVQNAPGIECQQQD